MFVAALLPGPGRILDAGWTSRRTTAGRGPPGLAPVVRHTTWAGAPWEVDPDGCVAVDDVAVDGVAVDDVAVDQRTEGQP